MVKKKLIHFIITLIILFFNFVCFSQGSITYRIAFNSNYFIREPGSSDAIADPAIPVLPATTMDFTSEFGPGFEAEVAFPLNNYFSIGFEIEHLTLNGYNDHPIYYNYFSSYAAPTGLIYNQQSLIFNTKMNNLLVNIRYYLMGQNTFQPFLKVSSGVVFVGTDLRFKDLQNRIDIYDPLYTRGTKLSEDTKWPIFTFCGGGGFEFQITDKFLLYADATISNTQTDIINGIPNFSHNEESGINEHFKVNSLTTQLSAGISYSLGEGVKLFNKKSTQQSKGFGKRKGKIHKYFPFYEIKN